MASAHNNTDDGFRCRLDSTLVTSTDGRPWSVEGCTDISRWTTMTSWWEAWPASDDCTSPDTSDRSWRGRCLMTLWRRRCRLSLQRKVKHWVKMSIRNTGLSGVKKTSEGIGRNTGFSGVSAGYISDNFKCRTEQNWNMITHGWIANQKWDWCPCLAL